MAACKDTSFAGNSPVVQYGVPRRNKVQVLVREQGQTQTLPTASEIPDCQLNDDENPQ